MYGTEVRLVVFAALAGCAALVACSDDGDPTDPLADCLAQAGVTGPAVGIVDFEFQPATLTIEPGTAYAARAAAPPWRGAGARMR